MLYIKLTYSDATPIKQGVLGDCWLLSTCAALAKKEELLFRVIDPKQVENLIREKPGDEIKKAQNLYKKRWYWNIKVIKTTQVLYGPEYTGLIQVKDKPFPLSHFRILHQSRSLTQSHTLSPSHSSGSDLALWPLGHCLH